MFVFMAAAVLDAWLGARVPGIAGVLVSTSKGHGAKRNEIRREKRKAPISKVLLAIFTMKSPKALI
jgi:hypothetical protein